MAETKIEEEVENRTESIEEIELDWSVFANSIEDEINKLLLHAFARL